MSAQLANSLIRTDAPRRSQLTGIAYRRVIVLIAIAIGALLITAANAGAIGTVGLTSTKLSYTAGVGETNALSVSFNGSAYVVTESGGSGIQANPGCTVIGSTATCPSTNPQSAFFALGDGDDSIAFASALGASVVGYYVNAGPGSDSVDAGLLTTPGSINMGGSSDSEGYEFAYGGSGAESISTGNVANMTSIDAGAGDDAVVATGGALFEQPMNQESGGTGASYIEGGFGDDFIDTSSMVGDVFVGFGNGDDMGIGGDGIEFYRLDTGVDIAYGNGGDDRFLDQHQSPNVLEPGDDFAYGGPGDDQMLIHKDPMYVTFDGGEGSDWVDYFRIYWPGIMGQWEISLDDVANDGHPDDLGDNILSSVENVAIEQGNHGGDDVLVGSAVENILNGNGGSDVITGGAGSDHLNGGVGNDTIFAADGEVDWVNCGGDTDSAEVDSFDVVSNCESVTTP